MAVAPEPGHLFITRGDLTKLECDAWLVPTDAHLAIESPWARHLRHPLPAVPEGWSKGQVRVMPCAPAKDGGPAPWLVNVGAWQGTDPSWHVDGVRGWIAVASRTLSSTPPRRGRARHLLALPVVGTGQGGAADVKGKLTGVLVQALAAAVAEHGVDIALVTHTEHAFAAAQVSRRRLASSGELDDPWARLPAPIAELARTLARDAQEGRLVLFLGAGIGRAAGLPLWEELIAQLAATAGMPDSAQLIRLADPLDRARIVEGRLEAKDIEIGQAIATSFAPFTRCALAHTLLAALPVTEVATTNYDTLFEQARDAVGRPLAVLPYSTPSDANGWILKMHGSVEHPEDIVLTRDDYLGYGERRAALKGIVQALLITRRMLFLGFSLTDPTFHQVVHDVRRAVPKGTGDSRPFGTAVLLRDDPMLAELWRDDLDIHAVGGDDAARRLEIFLDLLLAEASPNSSHLLDPGYSGLLTDAESSLRDALLIVDSARGTPAAPAPAWARVDQLLRELGKSADTTTAAIPIGSVSHRRRMRRSSEPVLAIHADWSIHPDKRWMAQATRTSSGWRVEGPCRVPDPTEWVEQLIAHAIDTDGPAIMGFDFPIGVPEAYAEAAGIASFTDHLARLGAPPWDTFMDVCATADQISLYRPFYPHAPGGTVQKHLIDGLGLSNGHQVLRRCERAQTYRPAASPLFWTMGAKTGREGLDLRLARRGHPTSRQVGRRCGYLAVRRDARGALRNSSGHHRRDLPRRRLPPPWLPAGRME